MQHNGEKNIHSYLYLQILLYFNKWFAILFFLLNMIVFIYKGYYLPYPPSALGLEVFQVFLYAILEMIRIFQASHGNKTEQTGPLIVSMFLAIGTIVVNVVLLELQTYVLRIDFVINLVSICFVSLEVLISFLAMLKFCKEHGF